MGLFIPAVVDEMFLYSDSQIYSYDERPRSQILEMFIVLSLWTNYRNSLMIEHNHINIKKSKNSNHVSTLKKMTMSGFIDGNGCIHLFCLY